MVKKIVYVKLSNGLIGMIVEVLRESLERVTAQFVRDKSYNQKYKNSLKNKGDNDSESEESDSEGKSKKKNVKKSQNDESSEDEQDDKSDDIKQKKNTKKNKKEESSDEESEEDSKKNEKTTDDKKKKNKPDKKSDGGIKILELDEQQTIIIYVKLSVSEFTDFYVKPSVHKVGLDLEELHKYFKTVDKESVLSISIDKDDEQNIIFQKKTNNKNKIGLYKQKLMEPDDQDIGLPRQNKFELWVEMETEEFHKMIKHFNDIADYIEIVCTANDITFKTQGSTSYLEEKYINVTDGKEKGVKINVEDKNNSRIIVEGIFEIKMFKLFAKCHQLSDVMIFGLRNSYPLFIQYMIGENSRMVIGLSPIDPEKIKRNNNYDEEMDKSYHTQKKIIMKKNE
jgi:DNA mismatch repair ATPase MutL